MGEEVISDLCPIISEDKRESFSSMLLMGLLLGRVQKTETKSDNIEIVHKLNNAEKEIEELKRRRKEDAKANEKVAGLYASQEQNWFLERKKMRQHIGGLLNELRVVQTKKDETVLDLEDKLEEIDGLLKSKEKVLEQEEVKRREIEDKLKESQHLLEELKENAKREAQEHCNEIWKHKTAFIELVSNQRQIEAEMGRALNQSEALKQELNSAFEQKEEAVLMAQKLSLEMVKTRKDLDQKDKILSAMLRKLKMDSTEKQMLLKELKLKSKRKQAELERAVSETRRERHSLKRMLSKHTSFKFRSNIEEVSQSRSKSVPSDFLLEYNQIELQNELQNSSPTYSQYSHEGSEELMFGADVKHLENWVRSEAEKYSTLVEQRHHLEVNAFSEQLRLKDERLEGFRWRLLGMELESKRLQTYIEELNHDISQLRQENMKLGTLVLEKEDEVNSLKHQFALKFQYQNQEIANLNQVSKNITANNETIWSNVKIIKRKPVEKDGEETNSQEEKESSKDIILTVQSPENELEEEKDVDLDPGSFRDIVEIVEKPSLGKISSKNTVLPLKMDIQALNVSYKIKRLKQQLLMLEKFTGKQKSDGNDVAKAGMKEFHLLMQFMNKQINRYQSLQEKIDELSTRMHENEPESIRGDYKIAKSTNETKALTNYLEETFQLQRYIVASGQKLMELQTKIVSGFTEVAKGLEGQKSFDLKRCGDSVGAIFKEIQRGLEVRIARIIGDVEGTLACDGIIHLKR